MDLLESRKIYIRGFATGLALAVNEDIMPSRLARCMLSKNNFDRKTLLEAGCTVFIIKTIYPNFRNSHKIKAPEENDHV